ncbi:uncharacterized protein si:dkeyp-122a9.2 [Astyanax mexicanus]|uniref:Uncharacterized protein n=1 Tax=Astyanax mexicanus TaxID=7994 RepID=A0A8T2KNX5_ASTMX|nr:uncharacterized protein si:dkeyp-122a9.2 [Astyanax mexicanus]KAG9261063.1 hypothetical protein AMEX_G26034 [Astyanax mexicanus]
MSVRIQEVVVIVWQKTRAALPLTMTCLINFLRSPLPTTITFFLLLLGAVKLMGMVLSCPCKPGVNEAFVFFTFVVPAVMLFTLMLVLIRPCQHRCRRCSCGSRFTEALIPCLIPSILWVVLLLLDGQYVACGLTYWKGNYELDDNKPEMVWCVPSSSGQLPEKALYQRFIGWSQVSGLILLLVICTVTMFVVGCRDCRQASEGNEEEAPLLHS